MGHKITLVIKAEPFRMKQKAPASGHISQSHTAFKLNERLMIKISEFYVSWTKRTVLKLSLLSQTIHLFICLINIFQIPMGFSSPVLGEKFRNNIIPLPTSKHKDKQVQLQINTRIKNGFYYEHQLFYSRLSQVQRLIPPTICSASLAIKTQVCSCF